MAWPLWDMAGDLAVARAGRGSETDADPRYLRGRIASIIWLPGAALCLVAGAATASPPVGMTCFALLIAGLWLFAFRPGATSGFLRSLVKKT
jgi:hypothetical protein